MPSDASVHEESGGDHHIHVYNDTYLRIRKYSPDSQVISMCYSAEYVLKWTAFKLVQAARGVHCRWMSTWPWRCD